MKTFYTLFLVIIPALSMAQTFEKHVTASNGERIGFLEFRPPNYSGPKHPLIIFLHGIGEKGNGGSDLRRVNCCGIPSYIRGGNKMRFTWMGKTESFVVLSPQLSKKYSMWQPFYTDEMIKYAKANLNIDPNRIFVTGLSMGGGGTWNFASSSQARAEQLAGIAPVVAPCMMTNGCNIAKASLPVLAIHVWDDKDAPASCTVNALKSINACSPSVTPSAIMYASGGHYVWMKRAFDTAHDYQNPNMFEWFLAQNKTYAPNKKPRADAGKDQSITTSDGSIILSASASGDADGGIVRYIWSRISGPAKGTLSEGNTANVKVGGLNTPGAYKFQLKVVDNRAEWDLDTVVVNVAKGDASPNDNPVAKAGSDISIDLPAELTLDGSPSYDPDGNVIEYLWTKEEGPAHEIIDNEDEAIATVSGLVAGTYKFRLTVTDNRGETDSDEITVTVKGDTDPGPDPDTIPDTDTIPDRPSNSPLPNVVSREVSVYPNPTSNDVVLKLNTYHRGHSVAVIYDNMGRAVKRINFVKNQVNFLQRLPTSGLAKGLFYVDIMIDRKGRFKTKFIKR